MPARPATARPAELVRAGRDVALVGVPPAPPGELAEIVARWAAELPPARAELTVPVGALGADDAAALASAAGDAGFAVALEGPADEVDRLEPRVADRIGDRVRTVVAAAGARAEQRCRALAGRRVRLVQGRGAAADLAFVRCLSVLMAGAGEPAVAATDPRFVELAVERAAWHGRAPGSWEHVLPDGRRADEARRLVGTGYRVRIAVPVGQGRGRR